MAIMKPNERLLDTFRGPGSCELCGLWCMGRDAHHAFERGVNSWKRIDLPWNLISLGTMFPGPDRGQCKCHAKYHNGLIKRVQILEKIAAREGVTVQWIIGEHTRMLLEGGKGGRSGISGSV